MTIQPAGKPRSILLEQLPADVMARLAPDLHKVDLAAGKVLCKAGALPGHVYFPCSGLVSMRYLTSNGDAGEIASVGNEGVIGATLLFGSVPNAIRAVVQTPGTAIALKTDAGLREFARNGIFQAVVLRYTTWLLAQVTQAAICNRHHSIERRLTRYDERRRCHKLRSKIHASKQLDAPRHSRGREHVGDRVPRVPDGRDQT